VDDFLPKRALDDRNALLQGHRKTNELDQLSESQTVIAQSFVEVLDLDENMF